MGTFLIRVELHRATEADYENLHKYMAQEGFSPSILGSDGVWYKLPPAEYHLTGNFTAEQVRDKAARAALKTGREFAVLTSEYARAAWTGLLGQRAA